jgi:cell shape-determining protein MreD
MLTHVSSAVPISALAFGLVTYFMQLRIPPGRFAEKLRSVDWIGSVLFVISSTLIILGLTFGGDQFPWKSAGTLVPLILGLVFLPIFVLVEKRGHPRKSCLQLL